jgi:hypothetical protein
MKIKILDQAEADLIEGFHFYETQQTGVGDYFLSNLYADIESLRLYGGIHLKPYKNYHRLLSKKVSLCGVLHGNGQNCFHSCHRGLSP